MMAWAACFETTPLVFAGLTLLFMGSCAFMSGQALALTWRPAWHAIPYSLLLGLADRFLAYALFHQRLTAPAGFLLSSFILMGMAFLAFRLTRARQMVTQYPWLYRRKGLLNWSAIDPSGIS